MKNVSLALATVLFGLLAGCSSTQETPGGTTPSPTVNVTAPPATSASDSSGQTADKPATETPLPPEEATPPAEEPGRGGRLAFQQCSEESRKVKGCTKELMPVCGEVDTGIRCVRAPCPSTAQQTFSNACMACVSPKTKGYWPMSCEDMSKPTAP